MVKSCKIFFISVTLVPNWKLKSYSYFPHEIDCKRYKSCGYISDLDDRKTKERQNSLMVNNNVKYIYIFIRMNKHLWEASQPMRDN